MNDEVQKTAPERQDEGESQETEGATGPVAAAEGLPELQVWREFATQYGQQTLLALVVVTVIAGGIRYYRHHTRAKAEEAVTELFKARTLSERQSWVERYPKSDVAPVGELRLAAAQYAGGNYARAKDVYEAFLRDNPGHSLAPMAQMGLAHSLEASGLVDAGLKAFEAFMSAYPKHFLYAEAVVGKSRCLQQLGRMDDARTVCEDYVAANPGGEFTPRVEEWLARVKRIVRRGPEAAAAVSPLNLTGMPTGTTTNVVDIPVPPVAPAPDAAPTEAPVTNAGAVAP